MSSVEIDGVSYTLKSLFEKYPLEFLGNHHYEKYGANTQFLLKFLDSSIRLHLQAHPTIEFSKKHLNSNSGKTEAYVILGIRDEVKDPYIYLGFQNAIDTEVFKEAIINQNIEKLTSCFEKIPIKAGDVFIVPGGLPHAIGEGVFMIEIMEPTDFAVRLEFEKGGYVLPEEARFMSRGVDFALDMMNFNTISVDQIKKENFCLPKLIDEQVGGKEFALIATEQTPCFSVNKLCVSSKFTKTSNSFYVGIVTKGTGLIKINNNEVTIKTGDKFLIPFKTSKVNYISNSNLEIVFTFPPK